MVPADSFEEDLDPRIQVELEKLNSSTDVINKLEQDLEVARSEFRFLLSDSTKKLDQLSRQIGPSLIDKTRPYYEARMLARRALCETQQAASKFEKASGALEAAKEMVTLAEEGFMEKETKEFDLAWQEMLNHATNRVNESEKEKISSADDHKRKSRAYERAEQRVKTLEKNLKRSIKRSRPYFEMKAKYNQLLDDQKRQVQVIEETIQMTKNGYSDSLKELEKISEEIHEKRRQKRDQREEMNILSKGREAGVGSEHPDQEQGSLSLDLKIMRHSQFLKEKQYSQTSINSSTTSTPSSTTNSPARTPSYELLNEVHEPSSDNLSKNYGSYLSPELEDEDEMSDSESMASMDVLDDDMVQKLMLSEKKLEKLAKQKSLVSDNEENSD